MTGGWSFLVLGQSFGRSVKDADQEKEETPSPVLFGILILGDRLKSETNPAKLVFSVRARAAVLKALCARTRLFVFEGNSAVLTPSFGAGKDDDGRWWWSSRGP
uniref:Secreted protein n=1 Tax=Knipowitschia caucasica TaxID=637954 RepID=A0AAV2JB24_KNICA